MSCCARSCRGLPLVTLPKTWALAPSKACSKHAETVLFCCIMVGSSAFSSRVGFGSLCPIIYHALLRRVVFWPLIWCDTWCVIPRPVMTFLPATCLMPSHCGCFWYDVCFKVSASWHVCPSRVVSYHVISCHAMSCHVMSSCVASCPVISAPVTLASSGILSRPLISCLVTWRLTSKRVLWMDLIDRKLGSALALYLIPVQFDLLRQPREPAALAGGLK